MGGPLNLVQEAAGEGVRAVLNEADESVAEHHDRIPSQRCCFHTLSFPGVEDRPPIRSRLRPYFSVSYVTLVTS